MGEQIRNNVRERYLDLIDWVDIRPDINWPIWCAGGLAMVALMGYYLPKGMIVIAAVMGTLAAFGLFVIGIVGALAYVAVRGVYEVAAKVVKSSPAPRVPAARRLQLYR